MIPAGGAPTPRFIYDPPLPEVVKAQRPSVRLGMAFGGIFGGIVLQNLTLTAPGPVRFVMALLEFIGLCWFVLVFADLFMRDYGAQRLPLVGLVGACVGFVSGLVGSRYDPIANAILGAVIVGLLAVLVGWAVLVKRRKLPAPPPS